MIGDAYGGDEWRCAEASNWTPPIFDKWHTNCAYLYTFFEAMNSTSRVPSLESNTASLSKVRGGVQRRVIKLSKEDEWRPWRISPDQHLPPLWGGYPRS